MKDESRNRKPFWIVWNPRGYGHPVVRHETEASAIEEAERLSQKHEGHHIYVLENIGHARVQKPSTFRYVEE